MWHEQAIIDLSCRVISIVACCHSGKLCAHVAWAFPIATQCRSTSHGSTTAVSYFCVNSTLFCRLLFGVSLALIIEKKADNFCCNKMTTEQQTNLKFLVQLGKTTTEAYRLLQDVYGDDTTSRARAFEWHRRFKEVREDVEDDSRSRRSATSRTTENVELVCKKLLEIATWLLE